MREARRSGYQPEPGPRPSPPSPVTREAAAALRETAPNDVDEDASAVEPRLSDAIRAYDGADLVLAGLLANVETAIGDFLRVAHELPADMPADLRAAVEAVVTRL